MALRLHLYAVVGMCRSLVDNSTLAYLLDNTAFTRVVPLPPAGNTGVVDYEPVFLSVAVAGLGLPVILSVTILRQAAAPQILGPLPSRQEGTGYARCPRVTLLRK